MKRIKTKKKEERNDWKKRKLRDYYAYEKEKLKWELERRKKEKLEIDLKDKEDCVVGCNEIEKERFGIIRLRRPRIS